MISYDDLTDDAWQAYLWWRDWDRLWRGVGAAEEQWATLYVPFRRAAPRCHAGAGHDAGTHHGIWGVLCWRCWAWVQAFRTRLRRTRDGCAAT